MSNKQLKPCPFCGGELKIVDNRYDQSICIITVGCDKCRCMVTMFNLTEERTVRELNKRFRENKLVDVMEEVKQFMTDGINHEYINVHTHPEIKDILGKVVDILG